MKRLAILLFLSASALADADLAFFSMTADRIQVVTGERLRVTARVRNNGPDAARNARVTLSQDLTGYFLDVSAPAGWSCEDARYTSAVTCTIASFAAGAEAEFSAASLAPLAPTARHSIGGVVFHDDRDPLPGNLNSRVNIVVSAASTNADLTLAADPLLQVAPNAQTTVHVQPGNTGPDDARDVAVIVDFTSDAPAAMSASGTGWRCEGVSATRTVCTRTRLASGATVPIELHVTAPANDQVLSLHTRITAELIHDPQPQTDLYTAIYVGAAENWRRILLPTSADRIAGANGALWRTDVRMLIASATPVEIRPHNCDLSVIPECFVEELPLRSEFDPRERGMLVEHIRGAGQFLYVRAADFEKVRFNARVYDAARQTETAGAELPLPRDDEFTSAPIDLLGIPVAPQYRHTLRIYDLHGRNGTRAIVRVYAGAETEPRATHEVTLGGTEEMRITTALLPVHAAFAQLTLAELLPLDGIESVRIEVAPADPGARLWSFVTITNNDTHHVTTVSPQ